MTRSSSIPSKELSAKVIYSEIDNNPLFSGLAEVLPDISYSAAHPELKMTIIFPQAARRLDDGRSYPTIVFVQGSGWTSPNIYYEIPQLSRFAQLGYIVATLTHRSALDGTSIWRSVRQAIRFLREKAEEYKVDPHRMHWGTSSGGNTALLAGLTGGDPAYRTDEYPEQSDHVRMVVDCFGPADAPKLLNGVLEQAKEQPLDGHDRKLFYGLLGETPEEQKSARGPIDPIGMVADKPYPPFLLVHGTKTPSSPMSRARPWPRPSPATSTRDSGCGEPNTRGASGARNCLRRLPILSGGCCNFRNIKQQIKQ